MSISFFKELKRRNVYKVAVAYLVVVWLVIQVTLAAVPALHLPGWINSAVFLFGALGFPFALFFAWEFELTPEGVKRESDITPEDSVAAHTGRKLDFIIIGLLAAALVYFIYESRFDTSPAKIDNPNNNATEINAKENVINPEGASIAVLAFKDMSPNKDQEYFSDGISEEILNVLAKLPRLKVTSRSSAFAFKGQQINLSEVAKKLGVNNILEGSVRKSGNRIRITAQLIDAQTDKHLWSETYDRELSDIFVIQDEISAAIVQALKFKLGIETNMFTRDMSNVNIDAHNEYLKGRFYIENRTQKDIERSLIHFNKAIAFAPDYASAWMGKAWAIMFLSERAYGNIPWETSEKTSRPAIEKALILNPNLPEAHAILGLIESNSNHVKNAAIHYEKAIDLNPNYADAMSWYANLLYDQPKKRHELYIQSVKLNPMSILANNNYAIDLLNYGKIEKAQTVYKHMLAINDKHPHSLEILAKIRGAEGKYAEATIAFEKQIANSPENIDARINTADVLSTLKLNDKAASYVKETIFDPMQHWYLNNVKLYLNETRATFPRGEDDSLGYWVRAKAEARAENYTEAAKYFSLSGSVYGKTIAIYSYQQAGNAEKAQALLQEEKLQLSSWLHAGGQYGYNTGLNSPIAIWEMDLAYLDGDIERAIEHLKKAMKSNYIIHNEYIKNAMYTKLRAHPDWEELLEISNKRADLQRKIYAELLSETHIDK